MDAGCARTTVDPGPRIPGAVGSSVPDAHPSTHKVPSVSKPHDEVSCFPAARTGRNQGTMLPLEEISRLPLSTVAIDSLREADSPRRSGEDMEHIHALAQSESPLPPIVVCRSTMRVIDGMHRLRAAKMRGESMIEVRLFDGDRARAFLLAVRSNVAHGLPLSLTDRKAAASRIIESYPEMSNRMIALATGLSAKTVTGIRGCPTGADSQSDSRVGRDGRTRPVNSAERREVAIRLMSDNPQASLREIAP